MIQNYLFGELIIKKKIKNKTNSVKTNLKMISEPTHRGKFTWPVMTKNCSIGNECLIENRKWSN